LPGKNVDGAPEVAPWQRFTNGATGGEPPVFGNLLRGLVQPILVSGKTDYLDGRKPLGRIGSRIAQRSQLAHGHQNLNVVLRKAEQFRCRHDIKARWQIFRRPGRQCRMDHVIAHSTRRKDWNRQSVDAVARFSLRIPEAQTESAAAKPGPPPTAAYPRRTSPASRVFLLQSFLSRQSSSSSYH
jgi:hypothetical protein